MTPVFNEGLVCFAVRLGFRSCFMDTLDIRSDFSRRDYRTADI